MKKILLFVFSALAVVAVSCNKNNVTPEVSAMEDAEQWLAPIEFAIEGEFAPVAETRGASEVTTDNFSSMKVTATTGTSSETAVSGFGNTTFTKSGSVWKGGKYWPVSNPGYHFYASNAEMTHTNNGQTVSPQNAGTDVIVGYIASPTYQQSNAFTMGHIFAQIGTMQITAPSGYTVSELKVSLKPKTSGTYNLKSGSWTSKGTEGSATYILGTGSSGVSIGTAGGNIISADNDLWLVPDTYTLTATYKVSIGDYTSNTLTVTGNVSLDQGKNNNISATLPSNNTGATEIQFTVTVTPWSPVSKDVTLNSNS